MPFLKYGWARKPVKCQGIIDKDIESVEFCQFLKILTELTDQTYNRLYCLHMYNTQLVTNEERQIPSRVVTQFLRSSGFSLPLLIDRCTPATDAKVAERRSMKSPDVRHFHAVDHFSEIWSF
jgi:hypothetical protein